MTQLLDSKSFTLGLMLQKWADAGVTVTELTPEAVEEFKAASAGIYTDPQFVEMMTQELIDAFTK